MHDDAELWAWVDRVADALEADKAYLRARVRQCPQGLDDAGHRTIPLPDHETAE